MTKREQKQKNRKKIAKKTFTEHKKKVNYKKHT